MPGLRIGIDAHSIGSGRSGNETYYRSLLQALDRAADENEYVVYGTNESALSRLQLNRQRFLISRVRTTTPYVRIPFVMPLKANRDRVDIFHAQFIIPPFLRCRAI